MPKKIDAPGPFALRTPLIIQINTVFVNPLYQNSPNFIGVFALEETLADDICGRDIRHRNTGQHGRCRKHEFLHTFTFTFLGTQPDLSLGRPLRHRGNRGDNCARRAKSRVFEYGEGGDRGRTPAARQAGLQGFARSAA